MMKYDEIHIEDLEIYARHGVFPEETKLGQRFIVSVILYTNTRKAGTTDELECSIDYGSVSHFITRFMQENTYKLIEAAAENLVEALLFEYPLLAGVTLELKTPWAPIGLPLKYASVKISRFWHRAYLGMGSNMGDKKAYLDGAIEALNKIKGCQVEKVSEYLVTKPYGGVEQDDFLNACAQIKTLLSPEELLDVLHEIEKEAHRERIVRWGPRTLDLDILLYDDVVMETDDLIIPHIEMELRDFVLKPLSEIAPNLRHPVSKKTVTQMLKELQ